MLRLALGLCDVSSVALYGVRVSRMGADLPPRALFGTRMTVCSFTPSRIGIITSRRTWSKAAVTGLNMRGVSLGNCGYCGGWANSCTPSSAAQDGAREIRTSTSAHPYSLRFAGAGHRDRPDT